MQWKNAHNRQTDRQQRRGGSRNKEPVLVEAVHIPPLTASRHLSIIPLEIRFSSGWSNGAFDRLFGGLLCAPLRLWESSSASSATTKRKNKKKRKQQQTYGPFQSGVREAETHVKLNESFEHAR